MAKATWNSALLAESEDTIVVEGDHYFPPHTITATYFSESPEHTVCSWKGVASYFDVVVDGHVNRGAAWFYPTPSAAAADIRDYVAFRYGIRVE